MENSKTVVLVYSGGLDTSVCIPMMREDYGYERVVTVTVDVGQSRGDIEEAAAKARILGTEHYTVDAREEFARDYCFAAIRANGRYEGYPLSTAIARPLIAAKAVEIAKKVGATHFAHGCTGKGNDQFRIEFGIRAAIPDAVIHAPIRERNLTRSWELEYAESKGIPVAQSRAKIWSIDENLWGRSVEGGRLEEPDFAPPEEIYAWTTSPQSAPDHPTEVRIDFEAGLPTRIAGEGGSPASLIGRANELAGKNGIGRIDLMEDRLLGLKARENYECPGAQLLLAAHLALEALVLTRDEIRFKAQVDAEWSRLAYEGLWQDPFKAGLEAFIAKTQERVTGSVVLRLYKGTAQVIGRSGPWALYSEELASFDMKGFDQNESTGTVKNFGLQARMFLGAQKAAAAK
jgi:argininosuccinate synthase